eukprot:TRINITY_DN11828_c0_g1_i1.p1 TRINITY_DN11828_c0_g1~~TRINITY_DN11828_c0_g1_i1.p1  ORF type:complete len:120 (+),score=15.28 TRINITY_DN11828_c0_g1_i1:561-920(+)
MNLHPNIRVKRHGPISKLTYSHHQKTIIVDQSTAFVGGLDLCFGRYDDSNHTLVDDCHLKLKFPGKDYYNPRIKPLNFLFEPFADSIDRTTLPRMPWHDVHLSVTGEAAHDVAWSEFYE